MTDQPLDYAALRALATSAESKLQKWVNIETVSLLALLDENERLRSELEREREISRAVLSQVAKLHNVLRDIWGRCFQGTTIYNICEIALKSDYPGKDKGEKHE